jgi:hypothetical protein
MEAFLLQGEYLAPLDKLDAVRPRHRAWLDSLIDTGQLVLAGRRHSRTGSVVVVLAESEADAIELSVQDPYVLSGLARYSVVGFEAARWGVPRPTPRRGSPPG